VRAALVGAHTRRDNTGRVAVPLVHTALAIAAVVLVGLLLRRSDATGQRSLGLLVAQATGLAALGWAYVSLLLGMLVAIRPPGRAAGRGSLSWRSATVTLHRQVSLAVVALTVAHALTYALATPDGSLLVAFLPGPAPYDSIGYSTGVLALYLAVVLGPSYYLRDRIGRRTWLVAHQLAALTYALGLWHALFLGSDLRGEGLMRTLTWVLQVPLLALLGVRLRRPLRRADELDPDRRGGRFGRNPHAFSRAVLVVAVAGTFAVVLVMTLLAMGSGTHGTSILGLP
jgi:predicted ferric reductase